LAVALSVFRNLRAAEPSKSVVRSLLALVLFGVLLVGCASAAPEGRRPEVTSQPGGRDCLARRNAPGNAQNQARLVDTGYRVGGVSTWVAEAGGENGDVEGEGEGCSYLFHDDEGYISLTAHWDGDRLVWDPQQTQTGRRSPEQEAGGYASSHLVGPDGTARANPDWAPPTPEELEGTLATAPRGGRDDSEPPRISQAAPPAPPYAPLEHLVLTGTPDEMPAGCSAKDAAGLLDHLFAAFNRGDAQALETFFGSDFQYYVHPRDHIAQPTNRAAVVPFLLERHETGERR
jgi:hypothetical protein